MQKAMVFMVIVGSIMAVGMAMSFYGSQIIIQDLVSEQAEVIPGNSLEITVELDSSVSETGVYVVQTMNFKENSISAKISDPFGTQIISKSIESDSFEDRFEISFKGKYQLVIENFGSEETTIVGVLGHMPDKSKLSIGIAGFYLLIVGLTGMVGVGIYVFKKRQKNFS